MYWRLSWLQFPFSSTLTWLLLLGSELTALQVVWSCHCLWSFVSKISGFLSRLQIYLHRKRSRLELKSPQLKVCLCNNRYTLHSLLILVSEFRNNITRVCLFIKSSTMTFWTKSHNIMSIFYTSYYIKTKMCSAACLYARMSFRF